ncbi:hypothetical protein LCGC14_0987780 [marine sediment metagenome]|uniref:Uncharacterized protein n=1 Tax=marine sediment metagenome TaxID=412755 RepID=A0A0F9NBD2_9ZZZZ
MSEKKGMVIKFLVQPTCETCGRLIYRNEKILFLFMKIYHLKCGYHN